MNHYIALFEKSGDGDAYGVVFPDFPGCVSAGATHGEAVRMAHEALAGHVRFLQASGEKIPKPRTLEQIKTSWEDWKEWKAESDFVVGHVALLPVKSTTLRVSIMMDDSLLAQIDQVTDNRSSFFAEAAKKMLGNQRLQPANRLPKVELSNV